MSAPNPTFRVEPVREENVATCIDIITKSFSAFEFEQRLGNTPDEAGRKSASERHIRAWRQHFEDTGSWPPVRCVHVDPSNGNEMTVACAEWYFYPKDHMRNDERGAGYLISASWLPGNEAAPLKRAFQRPLDLRAKLTQGMAYGLLIYMATDPKWRRRGAATACVQWGLDRCAELDIPAYLEASKEGAPVYQRLGFEIAGNVEMELDGEKIEFPAMIWLPRYAGQSDNQWRVT